MALPLLMGVETEYAITAFNRDGSADPGGWVDSFIPMARQRRPYLADAHASKGVYLGNAARFLIDAGLHPEYATPECTSPRDAVTHVRAGDRLMLELSSAIAEVAPGVTELAVFRNNVDYGGAGTTWGSHESLLFRGDPRTLPAALIGHLVTRIIYTGAGGFNPLVPGAEFTLSPRVWMLEHVISANSTSARGIFHTKDESLSVAGYHRLHVLCGESVCSDLSLLLRVGVTALIVATIDAGEMGTEELELMAPLESIRAVSSDPECRASLLLRNGERLSAIDLQRRYLRRVDDYRRRGGLPEWADEICTRWSHALDQLARQSPWLEENIDWAMKRALFRRWAGSEAWSRLGAHSDAWRYVSRKFEGALKAPGGERPTLQLELLLSEGGPIPDAVARATRYLRSKKLDWEGVKRFCTLRAELMEIDVRFGQLGPRGVFEQLQRLATATQPLIAADAIMAAQWEPPLGSRAKVRGELIQSLHESGKGGFHGCGWTRVSNLREGRHIDLCNPFETEARWQRCGGDEQPVPIFRQRHMEEETFF